MFNFQNENVKITWIAGLCTVLGAGVSNYKDIYESFTQEKESDDINVELRRFIELTGLRISLEEAEKDKIQRYKMQYHVSGDVANCMVDVEQIPTSQLVEVAISAIQKHTTLKEIQEMNEFYSTPSMKNYRDKQPLIMKDMTLGMEELSERLQLKSAVVSDRQGEVCPDSNVKQKQ